MFDWANIVSLFSNIEIYRGARRVELTSLRSTYEQFYLGSFLFSDEEDAKSTEK